MRNLKDRVLLRNERTGEIYNTRLIGKNDNVLGSKILTEADERRNQEYKEKQDSIREISEFIKENEGAYVHLIYKYGYPLMDKLQAKCGGNKDNIHIIRFIQLATYTTFGGNLFDKGRHKIKKSSLKNIWDTSSRNSINETYDLLTECGYIYETEEGYIMINDEMIVKGAIENFKKLHKQDDSLTYTRLFVDNIQNMYEGTPNKARKQLANLFKILPFINFKHNVFCSNPTETDETKLNLYTWTDLARLCGHGEKNVTRFKNDLWKLKINGHNVIGEFLSGNKKAICVNPKVYYSGNDVEDVRNLYAMFKMCEGK